MKNQAMQLWKIDVDWPFRRQMTNTSYDLVEPTYSIGSSASQMKTLHCPHILNHKQIIHCRDSIFTCHPLILSHPSPFDVEWLAQWPASVKILLSNITTNASHTGRKYETNKSFIHLSNQHFNIIIGPAKTCCTKLS